MLSPSSSNPFAVVEDEDPIVHAARAAAEAAKGHLPSDAHRKATLSTTPLQSPPQHATAVSPPPPPPPPSFHSPSTPPPLDTADGDAVVIPSPSTPPSSSSSSPTILLPHPLPYLKPRSKYKLVLLGDEATGKTSILSRFLYDTFDLHYRVTIGIDFVSRTIQLPTHSIRLQLWDTAGQERFRSLVPSYIRDAAVALFVYDVGGRGGWDGIGRWVEDVLRDRGGDVLMVLVGNKEDLDREGKRQVSRGEGEKFAKDHGMMFGEVSAKEGTGIKQLMKAIVQLLPSDREEKERTEGFGSQPTAVEVQLPPQPNPPEAGGCFC